MKLIDLEHWPRRQHFELFREMALPHFSLCANVEVTALRPWLKAQGLSFNLALTYITSRAANALPEFRQRIRGTTVVEHEIVHPSFTVLTADELFSFCSVAYTGDFRAYMARAAAQVARVKAALLLEDEPGRDDYLFMTSIPWIAFTSIQHPIPLPADSVPRFAWGKVFAQGERLWLPLAVQGHHALMDGLHAGRFYERVQALLDAPASLDAYEPEAP